MEEELDTGSEVETQAAPAAAPARSTEVSKETEQNVQSKLDALFGGDAGDKADVQDDDVQGDDQLPAEDAATDEATGDEDTGDGEATDTDPAATPKVPTRPKGLPDAYIRSLKAADFSDEDIAEQAKSNPKFLDFARKVHESRVSSTNEWSRLGREKLALEQARAETAGTVNPFGALQPVDLTALKEHYGEGDPAMQTAERVNAAIEGLNRILPVIQASQAQAEQSRIRELSNQVESFFTSAEGQPYRDVFGVIGKGTTPLSQEQIGKRNQVLADANALMVGAELQGRRIDLPTALGMARDAIAGDVKVGAVRSGIVSTMKKRANSISLRPTTGKPAPTGKSGSGKSLESKVQAKLNKLFPSQ